MNKMHLMSGEVRLLQFRRFFSTECPGALHREICWTAARMARRSIQVFRRSSCTLIPRFDLMIPYISRLCVIRLSSSRASIASRTPQRLNGDPRGFKYTPT